MFPNSLRFIVVPTTIASVFLACSFLPSLLSNNQPTFVPTRSAIVTLPSQPTTRSNTVVPPLAKTIVQLSPTLTSAVQESLKLYTVTITETKKLIGGYQNQVAPAGWKWVVVGVGVENISTAFERSGWWQGELATAEGFNYAPENTWYWDEKFRNPEYRSFFPLPPGFRMLQFFVFRAGEATRPSRFLIRHAQSRKVLASTTLGDRPQSVPFPVGDRSRVSIETVGTTHKPQPYSPGYPGSSGAPPLPPGLVVTVASAKYSAPYKTKPYHGDAASIEESVRDLKVVLDLKNENVGQEATFSLIAYTIGNDGVPREFGGSTFCPYFEPVCGTLGPGQREQRELTVHVNSNASGHYLIFDNTATAVNNPIMQYYPWVVDLGQ